MNGYDKQGIADAVLCFFTIFEILLSSILSPFSFSKIKLSKQMEVKQ